MNTPGRDIPVSFFYKFSGLPPWAVRAALAEFVANGQCQVVLGDGVMRDMLRTFSLATSYRDWLADAGAVFKGAHSVFGPDDDLCCADEDLRPFMLENHKICMEIAASFGAGTITLHAGRVTDYSVPMDKYVGNVYRSLDVLLPEAERLGLVICLENSWYQTSTAAALLAYVGHYRSDSLGLCYDTGHANVMAGRNRAEANRMWATFPGREPEWNDHVLEDLLPHVVVCHVHDNDGAVDGHLMPGRGTVDWGHVMPLLKSAPRLKSLEFEAFAGDSAATSFSIREAVENMRRLVLSDFPGA